MNWFKKRNIKKIKENVLTPTQSERIDVLKAEIHRLESRLAEYIAREREIEEVLIFAKERAEEYEKESKIRFILERERLSSYREKWQSRLDNLNNADRLGEEILECNEFFKKLSIELKEIVEGKKSNYDEPRETYVRETKRLNELGVSSQTETMLSEEDLNKLLLQYNA